MTLKQLEAFYWAATCSSFAVAAQRLHLSVSSLSKRLAELEAALGQPLFDRSGHRATLTEAGHRLVPRARDLLGAAQSLQRELGRGTGLHGPCRFGVGELTALTWLPRLVARIRREHPGLALAPRVDIGEALEQGVEAGELDFAVVAGHSPRSAIASQALAQARFSWCAAPEVAGRARLLAPQALERWPLVTLPAGAGTTRLLQDWLAAVKADAPHRLTCNQWGAVAGLLAEGIGIGLLPEGWAVALERRKVLRRLHSHPPLGTLQYTFQRRRDDARPLVAALQTLCVEVTDFSAGKLF